MVVNEGLVQLLLWLQNYLNDAPQWGLFTSNLTITADTVLADVLAVEASWTGYARQNSPSYGTPTVADDVASMLGTGVVTWVNHSGSNQTFWGWFVFQPGASVLLAALNLGQLTVGNAGSFSVLSQWTAQDIGT